MAGGVQNAERVRDESVEGRRMGNTILEVPADIDEASAGTLASTESQDPSISSPDDEALDDGPAGGVNTSVSESMAVGGEYVAPEIASMDGEVDSSLCGESVAVPAYVSRWLEDVSHCSDGPENVAPLFEDVTVRWGLTHHHQYPDETPFYPKNVGGGAALADFDNDGYLDLYLTDANGANRLYFNDQGRGFTPCADVAGPNNSNHWTNGVSAVDIDGDGWLDLYLANNGPDQILRNLGGRRFEVSQAQLTSNARSGSGSWADADGDGLLDLFVASLAGDFRPHQNEFDPSTSRIFRNLGDFEFADQTASFGPPGTMDGSVFVGGFFDLDDDGDPDLYWPQEFGAAPPGARMFRNDGPGEQWIEWTEVTDEANVARPFAAMGMDLLDVDGDQRFDIFVSNLWGAAPQREVLHTNLGNLVFEDQGRERGAFALWNRARDTWLQRTVSWAAQAFDVDNDGDEDLYLAYGAFEPAADYRFAPQAYPPMIPDQPNALLINEAGQFQIREGSCAEDHGISRGVVIGDLDRDGCQDMVVVNALGATRILRNRCMDPGHWIGVRLAGRSSNRNGIGATVRVRAGGRTQSQQVLAGSRGVFSSSPAELHFGLGDDEQVDAIEVFWPSGRRNEVTPASVDEFVLIEEPAADTPNAFFSPQTRTLPVASNSRTALSSWAIPAAVASVSITVEPVDPPGETPPCFQLSDVSVGDGTVWVGADDVSDEWGAFCDDCINRVSVSPYYGYFVLPNNGDATVPEGDLSFRVSVRDCTTFQPASARFGDPVPESVRVSVLSKPVGMLTRPTLPLHLVDASGFNWSDESREMFLSGALASAMLALEPSNLELLPIRTTRIEPTGRVNVNFDDLSAFRALGESAGAAEGEVPVYLVSCFNQEDPEQGGLSHPEGVSIRIPGGGPLSYFANGVVLKVGHCDGGEPRLSWSDINAFGRLFAHELGHYLGLFHTEERSGTTDHLADTDDGTIMNATPSIRLDTGLSPRQIGVILGHPKVRDGR